MEKMVLKKGLNNILSSVSSKHWAEQIIDISLIRQEKELRITDEFHASSAGNCPRLIQLRMNGIFREKIEPRVQRIFDVGTSMHRRYREYFLNAGKLISDEVPIRINIEGIVIVGRADLLVKDLVDKPQVLEGKSMNTRRFGELLSSGIYIEENFLQWNIYSKGLEVPEGAIIYENKDDQRIKVFSVNYNDEKFLQVVNVFKMINEYNKQEKLVPKPLLCPDPKYCGAIKLCKEK